MQENPTQLDGLEGLSKVAAQENPTQLDGLEGLSKAAVQEEPYTAGSES